MTYKAISGTVAFCNLVNREVYEGKETDWYTLTLTLDEQGCDKLAVDNVKTKQYQDSYQRKFKTKTPAKVLDLDNHVIALEKEIPRGSKVNVLYSVSKKPHPIYGCSVYIQSVRLVEEAQLYVDGF